MTVTRDRSERRGGLSDAWRVASAILAARRKRLVAPHVTAYDAFTDNSHAQRRMNPNRPANASNLQQHDEQRGERHEPV
jgi:hypothetical protein